MRNTSKSLSGRVYNLLPALVIFSFLILRTGFVSEAAVSYTEINAYSKANGDTYSTLSSERKKGYEVGRKDALNNTSTNLFNSDEEIYGYYLYMYDHPAIANNASKVTKAQASETLTKAAGIVARSTGSTKYEKALSLHDLLCSNVLYYGCEGGIWGGQSAYEAIVRQKAVCNGYASAYKLLCDLSGIPCHIVYGVGIGSDGQERHAWNVVQLDDGQWYEVDPTWDDSTDSHDYFCQTTASFANHTGSSGGKTMHIRQSEANDPRSDQAPVANGTKYIYVPVTGIEIELPDNLYEGDKVALSVKITPSNATNKNMVWTSSNPSVAAVEGNGTLSCLKSGRFVLRAKPADGSLVSYGLSTFVLSKSSYDEGISYDADQDSEDDMYIPSITYNPLIFDPSEQTTPTQTTQEQTTPTQTTQEQATPTQTAQEQTTPAQTTQEQTTPTQTTQEQTTPTQTSQTTGDDSETKPAGTNSGKKKTIRVKSIKITGEKTLRVGSSIKLTASVSPKNATKKTLKWTSSKKSVATVNSSGKVTARKAGIVTIKATSTDGSKVYGSYKITVIKKNADPAASKIVKKTSQVKLKAQGNKKVKVSWKKQKDAIRYEIQIATDNKFKKNVASSTIKKGKASASIKYKKTGKVYIRVRAVDKYGYVGKWSDVKNVRIK